MLGEGMEEQHNWGIEEIKEVEEIKEEEEAQKEGEVETNAELPPTPGVYGDPEYLVKYHYGLPRLPGPRANPTPPASSHASFEPLPQPSPLVSLESYGPLSQSQPLTSVEANFPDRPSFYTESYLN